MTENGLKKHIIGSTGQLVKVIEKLTWRAKRGQNANAENGLTLHPSPSIAEMCILLLFRACLHFNISLTQKCTYSQLAKMEVTRRFGGARWSRWESICNMMVLICSPRLVYAMQTITRPLFAYLVGKSLITQKKKVFRGKKHAKKLKIHHICQVIANNKG